MEDKNDASSKIEMRGPSPELIISERKTLPEPEKHIPKNKLKLMIFVVIIAIIAVTLAIVLPIVILNSKKKKKK